MQENIIIIVISSCISIFIWSYLKSKFSKKRIAKKVQNGINQEEKAAQFLKTKGYKILSHHLQLEYTIIVDNVTQKIKLETDYTAAKDGKRYLIEVKSGEHTANINYAPTRRQLLEYYCASDYEGYILVNMHHKKIQIIEFPFQKKSAYSLSKVISINSFAILIICLGIGFSEYDSYITILVGLVLIVKSKSIYNWFRS